MNTITRLSANTITPLLAGFLCLLSLMGHSPAKDAYTLYNKKGKATSYKKMLKAAGEADIVLFGELHDNPIAHWLQLELTADLHAGDKPLVLGAEMFEADNQLLINEYLSDQISQKSFEKEVRLWPNYKTDYKPLLEFSKEKGLPFVATNIPRRYASMVFHKGLESLEGLSDEAKRFIAPLPVEVDLELPGYKALVEMGGGGHGGETFAHAQAVKDATMGHFIAENTPKNGIFIHYNGAYHSDNFEGISWYVKKRLPDTKIVTISTVTQGDTSSLAEDNTGKADFTICIPERMTRTY